MSEQSGRSTAYPIIARAASLLLKCAGFMDDRNAAVTEGNQHRDTYYAIDTDVITLYLEPEENVNYLDVFGEGSSSPTTKSLAFLLGDFLVASSEPLIAGHENQKCRFLVVPPHDEELLRQLSAIHRRLQRVADGVGSETFQKLSTVFEQYERDSDNKALLDSLRQRVSDLVELFNPYRGPKAALTRYALLPDTTLQQIESYLENGFTFPLLDPINDGNDRKLAETFIEQWEARLRKQKIRNKPAYALRRDAEVLATIEHVNTKLLHIGKQIVLVTGSNYLFAAADEYIPTERGRRSFADMYLRHPQAFLAHTGFFALPSVSDSPSLSSAKDAGFKLIDWLNLFFPSELRPATQPQGIVRRNLLRNIVKGEDRGLSALVELLKRSEKDARPVESLLEGWETQVASVARTRYADGLDLAEERGALELAKRLTELRGKGEWSVEKLCDLVFKESVSSISTLYSTTVWVGLWGKAAREQAKGVPALRFDPGYEEIETYCDDVVRLQLDSIGRKVSQERLQQLWELSKKVVEADKSQYHAHVVHALAFASKGHWYATLTLAKTAMAICDQMHKDERGFLLGREAAYLACIAARRSAKDRSGLGDAAEYLEEAIRRENLGAVEDVRFTAERLALRTRAFYFDFFCDRISPNIQEVASTVDELHQLVNAAESEKNNWVKHWVVRQTLTNYFSLLLILHELRPQDGMLNLETIRKDLALFQRVLTAVEMHQHKPENDPYAHLIRDISAAIWESDYQTREDAKKAAFKAVKEWDAFFMPYDEERLKFLSRIIPARRAKI